MNTWDFQSWHTFFWSYVLSLSKSARFYSCVGIKERIFYFVIFSQFYTGPSTKQSYEYCCIVTVKLMIKNWSVFITVSGIFLSANTLPQWGNKRSVKLVTVTKPKQFLSVWNAMENKQLISYQVIFYTLQGYADLQNDLQDSQNPPAKWCTKSPPIAITSSDNVLSKAILTPSR